MRTKIIISIFIILVVGGGYLYIKGSSPTYHFVTATRSSITERVDLTGSVVPVGTVSLSFQRSGTISNVGKDVGDTVYKNTPIAILDTQNLETQLDAANANIAAAEAKLKSLEAGATPATIRVSKTALSTAKRKLSGNYASAVSSVIDSYAKANDAVRTRLNVFFNNPETKSPTLVFTSSASSEALLAQYERGNLNDMFSKWQKEISNLSASSSPKEVHSAIKLASTNLTQIARFLSNVSTASINATSFQSDSSLTKATVQSIATESINETNTALANVTASGDIINTQEAIVSEDTARLEKTLESTTKEDIDVQQAAVDIARAKADTIRVQISQSTLRSPIDGTISVQNAKVGQTVSANQIVTTVFSSNELEADVNLPEVDLGKISIGDAVDITFDTFPDKTFTGKVFSIDPAETVISGVVGYKTKIHFSKHYSSIRSGLTANISIITKEKNNILSLPQYTLLQTDEGTFVETLVNGKITKKSVRTGIRDEKGNVEIVSGIKEGQKVLNIGLKSGS